MSTDFGFYPRTGWKGGQLTSMHRHRERSVFEIFRINWRGALLRHLAGK